MTGDTIAAIATAPGKGGVAIVRVSGPEARAIAERLTGGPAVAGRIAVKRVGIDKIDRRRKASISTISSPGFIDEAVVLFFRAPHSYTGEDVVEFQCHGGAVTPRRVLEACLAAGARLARRGEFTERAFLNGRLDYDQAEAVLDLVNARTARAADRALEGLSGKASRTYQALYEAALDLSTQVEHALDVDESELPDEFFATLNSRLSTLNSQLEAAIRRVHEGKLLREGALVVLAGPPNAGKSSLMNALLEENRAIVSDIPGTTRDTIEEGLDLDGWPIRLVDTAGLRETEDGIEGEGVKRAEELLAKADLVLWLGEKVEVEKKGGGGEEVKVRGEGEQRTDLHCLTSDLRPLTFLPLHAKCDLGRGEGLNVSAKTGEGLDELKREIVARLEARLDDTDADADISTDRLSALHDARAALSVLCPHQAPTTNHQSPIDLVLAGNALRTAADRLGSLVGAVYSEDFLDKLFSRFCVGK